MEEKCLKVWNCQNKYVSLQANNEMMKKESKPYPIIDEEDDGAYQSSGYSMIASEPVGAVAFAEEAVETKYLHIPGLPETWDELLDCLKEGEEAYERGEGVLWEDAIQQIRQSRRYGS